MRAAPPSSPHPPLIWDTAATRRPLEVRINRLFMIYNNGSQRRPLEVTAGILSYPVKGKQDGGDDAVQFPTFHRTPHDASTDSSSAGPCTGPVAAVRPVCAASFPRISDGTTGEAAVVVSVEDAVEVAVEVAEVRTEAEKGADAAVVSL